MHSSWGNTIDAPDAFARMGADVMRWQYCSQPPDRNLLFGFGPAHEIQRKLLTLWNSCKFFVDYANIDSWTPDLDGSRRRARHGARAARPLARRADARARRRGDARVRELAHGRRRPCVRVVRRRRLELVHPALASSVLGWRPGRAANALVRARPRAARRRAAHAVPHRSSVAGAHRAVRECARSPFTSRAGRSRSSPIAALLAEIAELRRVVELGRQARATLGAEAPAAAARARRRGRSAARRPTRTRSRTSSACARSPSGTSRRASSASSRTFRCSGRSSGRSSARCGPRSQAGDFEELAGRRRSRRRPRPHARRGARRAPRQGRLGGRGLGRHHRRARPPSRRRARAARVASTTSSTA